MHTQTFSVLSLRGMDERWLTETSDASLIQDMTWSSNNAWEESGGFQQIWKPSPYPTTAATTSQATGESGYGLTPDEGSSSYEAPATSSSSDLDSTIHRPIYSLHWFSQHNGARQWMVWEQQQNYGQLGVDSKADLYVFDGTLVKETDLDSGDKKPWRQLERWTNEQYSDSSKFKVKSEIDDRETISTGIRTQSETWGGNLYIVNGHNEPLVFDGEICESAGFSSAPPPPNAKSPSWDHCNTMICAVGHNEGTAKFGRYHQLHYSGMGPRGYAVMGAKSYNYDDMAGSVGYEPGTVYETSGGAWSHFRTAEQFETRQVAWQYRVTYVNERGQESMASEPSNVAIFENGNCGDQQHGRALICLDLPIGPVECVARRIYRTRQQCNSDGDFVERGEGARYYFLAEIQDNMSTSWVDHHPDTHLGSLLDEGQLGNFPIGTKFLATFKNTMFAAGSTDNTISYSAALFPEVYPQDNTIHVGDEDGGEITGMRATKNALIVFKTRGIYLVKGDPSQGFYAHTLNKDVGCVAPNSLAELPGLGLVFLSENGVMLLEGALENTGTITGVVTLSTTIPNQIERITKSASVMSVGAVYLRDREYWLAVPMGGRERNQRVLVYHYDVGSWSIRDYFPISCAITTRDHRGYLYFGSWINEIDYNNANTNDKHAMIGEDGEKTPLSDTGMCIYSRGFPFKGGLPAVAPKYGTSHLPFGSYFSTVQPAYLMVYAVGYGDNNLEINYEINRTNQFVRAEHQTAKQQDPNHRFPTYGSEVQSAEWGVDSWAVHRPTVVRYDISTTSVGPTKELKIEFSAQPSVDTNEPSYVDDHGYRARLQVIGYDIELKVGEQRRIKPLNEALSPDRR